MKSTNRWLTALHRLEIINKQIAMFGLFKKKSEVEKLQEKYQKLMKEAFDLSKVNRSESDKKYAEADDVQKKIEALQQNN